MTATSMSMAEPAIDPAWRGRVGMIGLIVAEISLFAGFVVAYLVCIGKRLNGPYPKDGLDLPLLNTFFLLSSSLTVTFAMRGLRRESQRGAGVWFLVTMLFGAVFLVGTAREWYGLIVMHGLTISTNLFGTTFY